MHLPPAVMLLTLCVVSQTAAQKGRHTGNHTVSENGPGHHISAADNGGQGESLFAPYSEDRQYAHIGYFEVGKVDFEHVRTPFFISCWILIAGLGKMAFYLVPAVSKVVPESCMLIIIGLVAGAGLNACLGDIEAAHHLDPDTFFLFLLPPIIFDAGYCMPNRLFFDNFGTILVIGLLGTLFNAFSIGAVIYALGLTGIYGSHIKVMDALLFSTLICAVDPMAVLPVLEEVHINEALYIVIFGESLLNDDLTVGLYHMFEDYVETGEEAFNMIDIGKGILKFVWAAVGGAMLGPVFGLLTAFVTRFTSRATILEPLLVFTMSYLAYLSAEIFHFSGIISMTFCALTMKHYVITNVSDKSSTTIKYLSKMMSSSSETAIFMLLGVATMNNNHVCNLWFVAVTLVSCIVFRSVGVVLLTWLVNRFRVQPMSASDVFVVGFGGLRGAVTIALVLLIDPHYVPDQQMFLTTTIIVVCFTVFLQGLTIRPLVTRIIRKNSKYRNFTINEWVHQQTFELILTGVGDVIGHSFGFNLRSKYDQLNDTILLPILTRKTDAPPSIAHTFEATLNDIVLHQALQEAVRKLNRSVARNSSEQEDVLKESSMTAPRALQLLRRSTSIERRLSYSRQAVDEGQLSSPCLTRRHQWEVRQGYMARSLVRASQRQRLDRRHCSSFRWPSVRTSGRRRRNSDPTSQKPQLELTDSGVSENAAKFNED